MRSHPGGCAESDTAGAKADDQARAAASRGDREDAVVNIDAVPEIEDREVIKQVPDVEVQFVEKHVNMHRQRSKW